MKPTKKAKITARAISSLGLEIINWDLGGQKSFRKLYLENTTKYFSDVETIFYIIDIQDSERFQESLQYLKDIVNTIIELKQKETRFLILFHKNDPDIRKKADVVKNIKSLKDLIIQISSEISFSFYETSIYDQPSLQKAFSDGVISISNKSKVIQKLLTDYMGQTFNSATVLLDRNNFIIASRATKKEYEKICEKIAPRLSYNLEKLEMQDLDIVDIVLRFNFTIEEYENGKEGMVFIKQIDFMNERLYLVALCLNHKVKTRSYELLPVLANNLKEILVTFN